VVTSAVSHHSNQLKPVTEGLEVKGRKSLLVAFVDGASPAVILILKQVQDDFSGSGR